MLHHVRALWNWSIDNILAHLPLVEIQLLFEECGGRKDLTLDILVIEAPISWHEPTNHPKSLSCWVNIHACFYIIILTLYLPCLSCCLKLTWEFLFTITIEAFFHYLEWTTWIKECPNVSYIMSKDRPFRSKFLIVWSISFLGVLLSLTVELSCYSTHLLVLLQAFSMFARTI